MFISQFTAFNYRSLKQIIIRLSKGKNVIVGKNNCGKSNIIKAIEILVGEKFPTYQNITSNDFYTHQRLNKDTGELEEVVADNLYLEATLEGRDINEGLLMSIKKQTAFSKIRKSSDLYFFDKDVNEYSVNYELFQNLDDLENREEIEILEGYASGKLKKVEWKTPPRLYEFLTTAQTIKLFFCKSRHDDEKNGAGIIVKDIEGGFWISHFLSKKLRDSLLTTTVISALRSHKDELRLVHYTWFGKLIAGIWSKNKDQIDKTSGDSYDLLIRKSSGEIKSYVDIVFSENTKAIRKLLSGAISHKSISFKFLDDGKNDMYKNVQVFVDDGIDRPIIEKGTGIQSAVIIALFSLYCKDYHTSSSLLIAEEPELYLHPQARRVISAELEKFLDSSKEQERQLIISTHSTEYLRNVDPLNITRVYKDIEHNCSIAKQLDKGIALSISTELKRFLWSNNTEIFFAEKVVLVEGGEVYLIPIFVDKIRLSHQVLDYENISVARVNGKGNFLTYAKMLACFGINYLVLGDLDCFKDEVNKFVNHYEIDEIKKTTSAIKDAIAKMPVDHTAVLERFDGVDKNIDAQKIQNLFERFLNGTIEKDDDDLLNSINYMQSRYTKGDRVTVINDLIGEDEFKKVLAILREHHIFIWSKGELENYYTDNAINLRTVGNKSKDIKALEISYKLRDDDVKLKDFIKHRDEIKVLCDCILNKNM